MKKRSVLLFFIFFYPLFIINAQSSFFSYGKPSKSEIEMTTYELDTTAPAVILYEYGNATINYNDIEGIYLSVKYKKRIKILNRDALDLSNVSVYLRASSNNLKSQNVKDIRAISTTLTNDGAVIQKSLKKEDVFTEKFNEYFNIVKFAIPDVQVGSVIDYEYTLTYPSQMLLNFHPWEFQSEIPKKYSEYNTKIPANYKYNVQLIGGIELETKENDLKKECFHIGSGSADCIISRFVMRDIPAFKKEKYMLSEENYISKILFELIETTWFDGEKTRYSKSWKDVEKILRVQGRFGSQSKKTKYFLEYANETIEGETNKLKKAKRIFYDLQNAMNWNGRNGIFSKNDIKEAFQQKAGNSTELNLILLNVLKAVSLNANPMLIATREYKLPSKLFPQLSEFNRIVVKLDIEEKSYLLDITDKETPFGMLPYECLNLYGRVLDFKKGSYWYDINSDMYQSKSITQLMLKINASGEITGNSREFYMGYDGVFKRKKILKTSANAYIQELENDLSSLEDFNINTFKIENLENNEKPLKIDLKFNAVTSLDNQINLIHPFVINRITANPFQLEKRNYPINFGYIYNDTYQINIEIPDNFSFTTIPESKNISVSKNLAQIVLRTAKNDNKLSITLNCSIRSPIILTEYYKEIKELFSTLITIQNNSPIVIQKKVY